MRPKLDPFSGIIDRVLLEDGNRPVRAVLQSGFGWGW